MSFQDCYSLIKQDIGRFQKKTPSHYPLVILRCLLSSPSFKITFWMRIGKWLLSKNNYIAKLIIFFISIIHKHNQFKTGIQIQLKQNVGGGLFFPHFSCIVVSADSNIGENCTIYQGVTIGSIRGKGNPYIGDNVVLCAHCAILGDVRIGNNVMIGAHAVVTKDIPDGAVVIGNPSKIINMNGEYHVNMYI